MTPSAESLDRARAWLVRNITCGGFGRSDINSLALLLERWGLEKKIEGLEDARRRECSHCASNQPDESDFHEEDGHLYYTWTHFVKRDYCWSCKSTLNQAPVRTSCEANTVRNCIEECKDSLKSLVRANLAELQGTANDKGGE